MAAEATRYGILVGVDGSEESDAAVRWAGEEARLTGLPVTLMHGIPPSFASVPKVPVKALVAEWERENASTVIEHARQLLGAGVASATPVDVRSEVNYGGVLPMLIDASKEARMVVVGSRGAGGFGRMVMGSVSSGLVRHAHGPVTVVHARHHELPVDGPVVVGIDGSPASEAATALAFEEADRRRVGLVAVHAWQDTGALLALGIYWPAYEQTGAEVLAERLAGWQERYPSVSVRRRLESGTPVRWLLEESGHAQLIVVGSHGRGGFAGMLLGSVSSAVVQSARIPVTVVRPR
jgi:nucleotide-binding universal stress UspA family protein